MYLVLVVCGPIIGVVGSYYITIAAIMGKLYSNSLLIIFNSRAKIAASTNGANNSDLVINSNLFGSRDHRLAFRRSITAPDLAESFEMNDNSEVELEAGGSSSDARVNVRKGKRRASSPLSQRISDNHRLMDPRSVPSRSTNPPRIDPGVHGFVVFR